MNIPPEVARAQGKHGIKGAAHGVKGGRPKLDLDVRRLRRSRVDPRPDGAASLRGAILHPNGAPEPGGEFAVTA